MAILRSRCLVTVGLMSGACALLNACFSSQSNPASDGGNDAATVDAAPPADATTDAGVGHEGGGLDAGTPADGTLPADGATADVAPDAPADVFAPDAPADVFAPDAPADVMAEALADVSPPSAIVAPSNPPWDVGVTVSGGHVYWISRGFDSANTGALLSCTPSQGDCGSPTILLSNMPPATQLANDGTLLYFSLSQVSGYNPVTCPLGSCSGGPTEVVNQNWTLMGGLAVDGTSLYYASDQPGDSKLWSCPKGACTSPATILQGVSVAIGNLAVDATNVYFTEPSGIYYCPFAGCPGAPTLLQATAPPSGLAVDATHVYWADPAAGTVNRCPIAGCGDAGVPTVLVNNVPAVNGLALDGTYVYYAVGAPPDAGAMDGVYWSPK